ncbi:MAG: PAS domain S-box protein [Methanoregulaceae archaeon]
MVSVLFVDDEQDLTEVAQLFLEESGIINLTIEHSPKKALDLFRTTSFDVIVSDYQMPGMTGIEFLKEVRSRGNTPFILFTGRGREEVVIEALNLGADFYLQKGGESNSLFRELEHKILRAEERRRALDALIDSEQRLFDIINFLPDATFAVDKNRNVIAWNKAIEEMTGIPARDILGKGNAWYSRALYPEVRPLLIDLILESPDNIRKYDYAIIERTGDVLIAETTSTQPRGKPGTFIGKASLLYDKSGNVAGAIESIRDITEARQTEQRLQIKEDHLKRSQQVGHIASWEYDVKTGRFQGSEECRRIYGFPVDRDETTLDSITASLSGQEKIQESINNLIEKGTPYNVEYTLDSPGGDHPRILNSVADLIRDKNGNPVKVVGVVRDITEWKTAREALQESEEKFRTLIEYALDGLMIVDYSGTVLFGNQAAGRIIGAEDYRQRTGKCNVLEFVAPESRETAIRDFANVAAGNDAYLQEYRIVSPTGRTAWVENIGKRITFQNKPAILISFHDITARKYEEDRISAIYRSFLEFGTDPRENISLLTTLAGKLLNATCALYNRIEDGMLCAIGSWNVPGDYNRIDRPEGHICYDVIQSGCENPTVISDVLGSRYAKSDPNVSKYQIRTYIGIPVRIRGRLPGSLCVLYRETYSPSPKDLEVLSIIANAIRIEDERRVAESALRESQEKYRDLLENLSEVVFTTDKQGIITYVSPAIQQLFDFSPDEVTGQSLSGFVHPSDLSGLSLTPGEENPERVNVSEWRARKKDGTYCWVKSSSRPVFSEGKFSGYHGIVTNISERKSAEEALRESESKFRSIVEASPDMVWETDVSGTFTYISPRMKDILGYEPRELLGKKIFSLIPPECLPRPMEKFSEQIQKKEFYVSLDVTASHRNGNERILEIRSSLIFSPEGKLQGLRGLARDITEQRTAERNLRGSEERFKQVAENAGEWIWETDENGIYRYSSSAVERILGYHPEELIGIKHFYDLFAPETASGEKTEAMEIYRKKGSFRNFGNACLHKNGSIVFLETCGTPMLDRHGNLVGYRGTDLDITEKMRLIREQELALLDIAGKNRMITRINHKMLLLSQITRHDISNKLVVLAGYQKYLEKNPADPAIADILAKQKNALKTITRILGFTKEYEKVGIHSPCWQNVKDTIAHAGRLLDLSQISVSVESGDLWIYADPLLEKVFYNILDNALTHGQRVSSIRIYPDTSRGDFRLVIADDGIGIPADAKQDIFQHSYGEGTGLGLFLAREILAMTGITIEETGEYGKGARFELLLPQGTCRFPEPE